MNKDIIVLGNLIDMGLELGGDINVTIAGKEMNDLIVVDMYEDEGGAKIVYDYQSGQEWLTSEFYVNDLDKIQILSPKS